MFRWAPYSLVVRFSSFLPFSFPTPKPIRFGSSEAMGIGRKGEERRKQKTRNPGKNPQNADIRSGYSKMGVPSSSVGVFLSYLSFCAFLFPCPTNAQSALFETAEALGASRKGEERQKHKQRTPSEPQNNTDTRVEFPKKGFLWGSVMFRDVPLGSV